MDGKRIINMDDPINDLASVNLKIEQKNLITIGDEKDMKIRK